MDIAPTEELASIAMELIPDTSFVESVCVPLLRSVQNSDGGWGFLPGAQSRVEATCWAVKALSTREGSSGSDGEAIARGLNFLTAAQLADGSWPAMPGETKGCWVTSLACWVLAGVGDEKYAKAIASGLRWICADWPRDSSWWRRWLRKLSSAGRQAKQNDALRGWGWTPGTASWAEPTAFALLALESSAAAGISPAAEKRRKLGEALLYDRMCPGGGWNCGNPEVYGVANQPLVIPTTWALLALRRHGGRRENAESLAWMEKDFAQIQGPGSFALAQVCMMAYERRRPVDAASFSDYYARNESLRSVQVAAWTILAKSDVRKWLNAGAKK
jgi:hypothetical protein